MLGGACCRETAKAHPAAIMNAPAPHEAVPEEAFCGRSTGGSCSADSDCKRGGCSREVCQSVDEETLITSCRWRDCYDPKKYNLRCGCVNGACEWKINEQ